MKYELISEINNAHSPIVQILLNRGLQYNDIEHFLNTTIHDLYDPQLLDNLNKGIEMLISHISNNDKIYVQVDADVDGFTSAAFLINYLNCLFPHFIQTNLIYGVHKDKAHGIGMEIIPSDVKLIIAPDSSSNEYDIHKKYKEKDIDILILDHHEADAVSEYACVINNQLCNYPTKSLSGVGVVYKFCSQIDKLLNVNYTNDYLDLVALGLIADVMDTRDFETQYIIQQGLKHIRNPLIKELMNRDSMHFKSDVPYMIDVAWYIAPFINAATRVGSLDEQILIFESMLEYQSYEQIPSTKRGCRGQLETKVEQAGRLLGNIKNRQNDEVEAGIVYVKKIIEEQNLDINKILLVSFPQNKINKNLNGLIANKIASEYQRPTLILQEYQDDDTKQIVCSGSGRGYDKSGFQGFRQMLIDSELALLAQGHESAFGFSIYKDNIPDLLNYGNQALANLDNEIKYNVDFIWDTNRIDPTNVLAIAQYKSLWGQKVDEPYIVIENVKLTQHNIRFLGKTGRTLKIELPNIDVIKMYLSEADKERLNIGEETWFANIIVTCDINEWNGNISPQFKLVDFDITKQMKWYF